MRRYELNEDKSLPKLPVGFCEGISEIISDIDWCNRNNTPALSQWHDYLDSMVNYISNPVIAWDNMNKYQHWAGKTRIQELGYDVTFMIKTNEQTHQSYVYVLDFTPNIEQFDLEDPSLMYENRKRGNVIRLTESDLHAIVKECVMDLMQKHICRL